MGSFFCGKRIGYGAKWPPSTSKVHFRYPLLTIDEKYLSIKASVPVLTVLPLRRLVPRIGLRENVAGKHCVTFRSQLGSSEPTFGDVFRRI